jgi:hypothetical protein
VGFCTENQIIKGRRSKEWAGGGGDRGGGKARKSDAIRSKVSLWGVQIFVKKGRKR